MLALATDTCIYFKEPHVVTSGYIEHYIEVTSVCFDHSGELLAVGDRYGQLTLYDVEQRKKLRVI